MIKRIFIILLFVSSATFTFASEKVYVPIESDILAIKSVLLKYTPVGSTNSQVLSFIKEQLLHKESKISYDKNNGALPPGGKFVGSRSISVYLGEYGRSWKSFFLVSTKVYAEWGFDNSDNLVGIVIIKEGDGP